MQQHFLKSEAVVEALVEAGEAEAKKVGEIGPGTGSITAELLEKSESVVAVEADPEMADALEHRFSKENFRLIRGVFPDVSLPEIDRCVSNPPFALTREVLDFVGERQLLSALVLQEEMVDRLVADPGEPDYGFLTVKTLVEMVPVKLRNVPSTAFEPEPDVDAAILKLYPNRERFEIEDREFFLTVAKALFTHDRKKVRNALVDARNIIGLEKSKAKDLRDETPHSQERVKNLKVNEIEDISRHLNSLEAV